MRQRICGLGRERRGALNRPVFQSPIWSDTVFRAQLLPKLTGESNTNESSVNELWQMSSVIT